MFDDLEKFSIYAHSARRQLTRAQQSDLARRIAAGDEDAIHELVEPHLLFAFENALAYIEPRNIPKEQVTPYVQASVEGLYRAAAMWSKKPDTRYDFEAYAAWWIRQYLAGHMYKARLRGDGR
jgi:DNA-directed RNA polymerase sigma subunit (sigma70/sigma32)